MSLSIIPVTENVTPILPAVTSRTRASIFNDGAWPAYLKWDTGATVLTALNGEVLPPKCRVVLDTTTAVTAITEPGRATTLRVQDESVA